MSYAAASVSPPRTRIRAGSTRSLRAVATSCTWTVADPLPNSALPTPTSTDPSSASVTVAVLWCPRGGMVAIIAAASPSPTSHPGPGGPSSVAASACSTRSRHWGSPSVACTMSSTAGPLTTSSSPGTTALRRLISAALRPTSRARSSSADSIAKIT